MRRQDHPIWRLVRHAAGVAKSTVVALIDALVLRPLNALFTFIVALVLLFGRRWFKFLCFEPSLPCDDALRWNRRCLGMASRCEGLARFGPCER